MREITLSILFISAMLFGCSGGESGLSEGESDFNAEQVISLAQAQLTLAAESYDITRGFPRTTNPDGSVQFRALDAWSSGFFAGCQWELYAMTGQEEWKTKASHWSDPLKEILNSNRGHEIAFVINSGYGKGYDFTGNPEYKHYITKSAEFLASRIDDKIGMMKSWDWNTLLNYPVIIDNMMSLEILFRQADRK